MTVFSISAPFHLEPVLSEDLEDQMILAGGSTYIADLSRDVVTVGSRTDAQVSFTVRNLDNGRVIMHMALWPENHLMIEVEDDFDEDFDV